MNIQKLKEAEAVFLQQYRLGFTDPGLASIRSRHKVDQLVEFTQDQLIQPKFDQPRAVCDALLRIVSRSSMVSRFEKPAFRSYIESLNSPAQEQLAEAFELRLYGDKKQEGFEKICALLARHKLAKWSLVSAVPFYFSPQQECFVKPTTAKGIIKHLEVEGLTYRPAPSWDFYTAYQNLLTEVRRNVAPSLAPSYAALTGFLMMST